VMVPAQHGLFLGSSMPIRDMDLAASDLSRVQSVAAQRGASGIDGTLSCAAGFAAGLRSPVTVILGDLATLHDLNALALVKASPHPITMVVINNDGGGIFSFLPVAESSPHFEKFFGTPHGLGFEKAAEMFGLDYAQPGGVKEFVGAYISAMRAGRSSIIEVRTSRTANRAVHADVLKRVAQAVGRG
ncbi:MAG TPA: thiamine pyrophosphate-binding protein, partial [Kiritimatiellia bacterium]